MAENQGTHVIAKIVTPDSEDTFATHDANTCEGGFHQVETEAAMLAITTERRKAGMECRITNDADPNKNGKYVLQNDLITWIKEQADDNLGLPPDDGWGSGASDTHTLSQVKTGDTREERWDKLLTFLDKISPTGPDLLSSLSLIIPNLWSANKQGENAHTQIDNIQTNVQPIATLNGFFGDSSIGRISAWANSTFIGARTLVDGTAGDDNGTFGGLTLFDEEVFNSLFQRIKASIQSPVPLGLNNIAHVYKIEHDTENTETEFYVDDLSQPLISNEYIEGVELTGVHFVSGVPTLIDGDELRTTFEAGNVISWYYNLIRIARLESIFTNNLDLPLPAPPLNRGINVPFSNVATQVLKGVYTEDASVNITAYNARALTSEQLGTDQSTTAAKANLGTIRIDTVSDESITVTSGIGLHPPVGPASAGDPFNSSQDLKNNEELQMLNGRIIYPSGDYSGNTPTPGPNYNSLAGGTYNAIRWRTYDLGIITNQNSFTFQILDPGNFTGTPIELGNFQLMLQVVGATEWLDANRPYPGTGNPAKNGDPALDVAKSTTDVKRVTFGTQPQSGRVLVRIGWEEGENKTFLRIQTA